MAASKYLRWFDTSAVMRAPTEGNLADFFVSGEDAFADIADRLEYDAGNDAIAYFLGWSFDANVVMRTVTSSAGTSLSQLLTYFASQGGAVHALLWDNTLMPGAGCAEGVKLINALPRGQSSAILDRRTPLAGTHHQKVQIIVPARSHGTGKATEPLPAVAYCGGMDLFTDRVGPAGLHDVHCKIRGPAADDLITVFQERWNDHPDKGADLTTRTARTTAGGSSVVQVCCTYPTFQSQLLYSFAVDRYLRPLNDALKAAGLPTTGDMRVAGSTKLYSFYDTNKGVQQIWRSIIKAISEAKKYIYLEDQYLVNQWVGDALAAKLLSTTDKDFRIVIVVLHPDLADIEQMWPRRRDLFAKLIAADPRRTRWTVVHRRTDRAHPYVHSKTWIFDDELVITGSANADRRGYTYNSEVDVVVAGDVEKASGISSGATTLAQDLRARLFAKHLGGKSADYLKPLESLRKWFGSLKGASVARFDPSAKPGNPDKYVAKLRASGLPEVQGALNFLPGGPDAWVWDNFEQPDPLVHGP
ncbi:MAG TPA: phospholipase D family protein [Acidimicrobiales bacterium]|jgi:phosphatidylserine/phosphatidylglycerophosphate/cardiolipin synthase-like enzyme